MDAGLLQAIRDAPLDDVPRLVCADWCEEQGQAARAEFIRVQVELANADGERENRHALLCRLRKLIVQHRPSWLGKLAEWDADVLFERGFVERACLRAGTFLKEAQGLFAVHPIWQARLTRLAPNLLPALLSAPELSFLTALNLSGNDLGDEGAEQLASSPALAHVTALDLNNTRIGDKGVAHLAASPHLAHLRTLSLQGNRLRNDGAQALVSSPHLGRLTSLALWGNAVGQEMRDALARRFRRELLM